MDNSCLGFSSLDLKTNNLFADLPSDLPEELVGVLAENPHVRMERIVFHCHASPYGFCYDQDENEWVVAPKGKAKLLFERDEEPVEMRPVDNINIPTHKRHRVEWVKPEESILDNRIREEATASQLTVGSVGESMPQMPLRRAACPYRDDSLFVR